MLLYRVLRVKKTVHTYTYDDNWKDQLLSYDGKTITYDCMGRPTNYLGTPMTWNACGKLETVTGKNGEKISYSYLSDGQRYQKRVNGKTTTYLYNNGSLLSETTGDETIHYYYDYDNSILGLGYQKKGEEETQYFFTKNLSGDIIGIYRSEDSSLVGTYDYDAWGQIISVKEAEEGSDEDGILTKNPFRYRGYYYDQETGYYYLNFRYYDPSVRRFISPDDGLYKPVQRFLNKYPI